MNPASPIEPAGQRASDADREDVATILGEAYASGRLTEAEHGERLDAAFAARTLGELEPLTRDLRGPVVRPAAAMPARSTAAFSKVLRRSRSVLPERTEAVSFCGALIMDLSQAAFPSREVTITVSSYLGKVVLLVPWDAEVYDEGSALLGKRAVFTGPPSGPDGPVIRLLGRSILGKLIVTRGGDG
jgi:Domain of unknown function (DUF1707)/Cell wall-active antibiotics response 4TMS YvqF